MKKTTYTIAIALISILITSCSDNNPVNSPKDDNFLHSGSSWVTEHYDLDANGATKAETKVIDTLKLLEPRLYEGKTAYPLYNGKDTTMYMCFSGKSLYIAVPPSSLDTTNQNGSSVNGVFTMGWMKVGDFDSKLNDSWVIFSKDTSINLDMGGGSVVPGQVKIDVKVTNLGEKTYNYSTVNIPVTQFKVSVVMNMTALAGLIKMDNTTETVYDISYSKGMMQTNDLGQITKANYMGQEQDETVPGSITKTIKYTIK